MTAETGTTLRDQIAAALLDAITASEGHTPDLNEKDRAELDALTTTLVELFADHLERLAQHLPGYDGSDAGHQWESGHKAGREDAAMWLAARARDIRQDIKRAAVRP